jgi:transposase
MIDEVTKNRIAQMAPLLTEIQRRKYFGIEALGLGHGGIQEVSKLTGASRTTIAQGIKELENCIPNPKAKVAAEDLDRIRKTGGGRKNICETNPDVVETLETLFEDTTIGNPLCWTTKSLRNLQQDLYVKGIAVSHVKVEHILEELGYSLRKNKKRHQAGKIHIDIDAQFRHINKTSKEFLSSGQPVIAFEAKRNKTNGNFMNENEEYTPKGKPIHDVTHDFPKPFLITFKPSGIYDVQNNEDYVNIGMSADTSEFAVQSISSWWNEMGCQTYPEATKLFILSEDTRKNENRLWKNLMQELANITGLEIYVSHFPPGTSKWNHIEQRLFSYICKNWEGRPLVSIAVVISLIGITTTKGDFDKTETEKKTTIAVRESKEPNINCDKFHDKWNYCISPIFKMNPFFTKS